MAITATATVLDSTVPTGLPSGYTKPTLPAITTEAEGSYTTNVAITESDPANATTGLNNVLAALETHFEGTQSVAIGLNAALTINVNLTVRSITRSNTQSTDNGGIFITGTEVYACIVEYEYEVV